REEQPNPCSTIWRVLTRWSMPKQQNIEKKKHKMNVVTLRKHSEG
ncbi:4691_t:CDS:1, partial [Dentiscutata heterogama]